MNDEQRILVREAIGWDDRKCVAEVFQDAGGKVSALDEQTYDALLSVAQWGAERVLEFQGDE